MQQSIIITNYLKANQFDSKDEPLYIIHYNYIWQWLDIEIDFDYHQMYWLLELPKGFLPMCNQQTLTILSHFHL